MNLGKVIRAWRLHRELDLRAAGKLFGISAATLMRLEQGREPSGGTLAAIVVWLMEEESKP